MKAPKDQYIIQIDVTNACVHTCSNCTRFCGRHKKPFFMEFDTFCEAVDSLADHPGLIGVMGGEPTLHPRFEEMCRYLQSTVGKRHGLKSGIMRYPTDQLIETRRRLELSEYEIEEYSDAPRPVIKGAGLWTSLTNAYLKHYEIIQDTFHYQNLNDHSNASFHQPILISRRELGIGDDEWFRLREKCWVNHEWSGSITPKGCFFCEVAAAFDMLYDGPGGLPIEKGWWKRDISDYSEQFHWCEMCGIPLKTFSRDAREGIDDLSPYHYKKFMASDRIRQSKKDMNVLEIREGKISEESIRAAEKYRGQAYINDAQMRVSSSTPVYAEKFYGVLVDDGSEGIEGLMDALRKNERFFEKMAVLTGKDEETLGKLGVNAGHIVYDAQNAGEKLKEAAEYFGKGKYVLFFTPGIIFSEGVEILKKCVINPGTLHYIDFSGEIEKRENDYIKDCLFLEEGICALLNSYALSYKNLKDFGGDNITQCFRQLKIQWEKGKVIEFSNCMNRVIYNTVSRNRSIKRNRVRNMMKMMKRFNRRYGTVQTAKYSLAMVRHYGVKMTVGKLKSRIY